MKQRTLGKACQFRGKGLHTGQIAGITVNPAPANTGVRFIRTDIGEDAYIDAVAENVTNTARCTLLSNGEASVSTIEHLMSALTGLGIDNALVEIDNVEVPILDGSASYYVKAFTEAGIIEQDAERVYITIPQEIEIKDEKTGSWVKVTPADELSYDLTVDFNSRVLGVQTAHWDTSCDYGTEIGPCRTFVFFHEIEYLFANNLIKGGDVDNAIVIVEHPVKDEQLERMSKLFNLPMLQVRENGYLNNLELHFPNECGRHKMLDMIGDMRLAGGYLKAHITGFKPGHHINTNLAKEIRKVLGLN
ncbi:MAG: UDP-3-O-acyl-N-acetylglucosamine deacetylase [Candidatus Cryptobacteroides sp.]|nr:UDP-3-O-acyl-N-acetylglucosamine deacetylase [Bacteroidales bacterium]